MSLAEAAVVNDFWVAFQINDESVHKSVSTGTIVSLWDNVSLSERHSRKRKTDKMFSTVNKTNVSFFFSRSSS